MKKLLSAILAFAMVLSLLVAIATINVSAADVWDGTAATAFAGGDGTKDNPYQIATAEQLKYFSDLVNGETTNFDYNSLYYKLTADLDLGGRAWKPIGNLLFYFAGDFDGDNHTISNFRIVNEQFAGLFGVAVGSIKNIKVERATITNDGVGPIKAAGFIVGQVVDNIAALEVSNCVVGKGTSMDIMTSVVNGNVDNEHRLGGIVGNGPRNYELNISNCINYSTIVLNNASCGDAAVAGITSFIRLGSVKNCVNFGKMVSKESFEKTVWVGGIIGGILSPSADITVTVENCINYGDLQGGYGTGGIIGTLHGSGSGSIVINNAFSLAENVQTITYLSGTVTSIGAVIGTASKHPGSMTNVKAFQANGTNAAGEAIEVKAFGEKYTVTDVEGYNDVVVLITDKGIFDTMDAYKAILTALEIDETDFPNPDEVVPGPDAPDAAPETNAPETNAPETNAPETNAPETNAPETNAPETNAPGTEAPGTEAPGTDKPEEKGGCGSVVAGGLAILAVVALAGVALKKRD